MPTNTEAHTIMKSLSGSERVQKQLDLSSSSQKFEQCFGWHPAPLTPYDRVMKTGCQHPLKAQQTNTQAGTKRSVSDNDSEITIFRCLSMRLQYDITLSAFHPASLQLKRLSINSIENQNNYDTSVPPASNCVATPSRAPALSPTRAHSITSD